MVSTRISLDYLTYVCAKRAFLPLAPSSSRLPLFFSEKFLSFLHSRLFISVYFSVSLRYFTPRISRRNISRYFFFYSSSLRFPLFRPRSFSLFLPSLVRARSLSFRDRCHAANRTARRCDSDRGTIIARGPDRCSPFSSSTSLVHSNLLPYRGKFVKLSSAVHTRSLSLFGDLVIFVFLFCRNFDTFFYRYPFEFFAMCESVYIYRVIEIIIMYNVCSKYTRKKNIQEIF